MPHPIGTAAHDVVRDRIVAQFRQLGYQTSLQQTFACNAYATCAPVANILARLPGDARADTLLVSAHYDSVAAGPGATDDGVGVATILETARAVRGSHFRNTILFLVTDGEEEGLLGAEAFIADATLMPGVAAAINIDNRGTSGRSYLFETSRHNQWLMPLIAAALPRPSASSFFFNLYELLPNDTDLSVFKRSGMAGINFACMGRVAHYHTALDDLRHVTPSTVQDHGDHVLAMTRALASTDLRQATDEDGVFFDVLSLAMLWWPQPWSKWMAAAALLILLIGASIRIRDRRTSAREITLGVASFFLTVLGAALAGAAFAWTASLRSASANWVAQPGPVIAAMWLIGAATAIVVATVLRRRAGFDGLLIGHALCWTAMSIAVIIALPGGSYLAVVPAIALAITSLLSADAASVIITSAVTAVLWLPTLLPLYDLVGRMALPVIAAAVALMFTTFTPLIGVRTPMHRAALAAMITTAVACVAMQLLIPPYTPEFPRRLNIEYVDDQGILRWDARTIEKPPAPRLVLPSPQCETLLDRTFRCRSMRNASRIDVTFQASDLIRLRVNGVVPPQQPPKFRRRLGPGWHVVTVRGASQADIEIVLRNPRALDAVVSDRTLGLPPEAAPLLRERQLAHGVPSSEGDGVVVRRRVRL